MPAKHAEAGLLYDGEHIPDGFYLVGDSLNEQLDFQKAVIDSVRNVTHIAPNDDKGCLIDDIPAVIEGVILVDVKEMGLCGGVTGGTYSTTTEVYPDSAMSPVRNAIEPKSQPSLAPWSTYSHSRSDPLFACNYICN